MYNQPTHKLPNGRIVGTLYKSPIDCLWKTVKTEGPLALYKGSTAHFLRIAPHTYVLTNLVRKSDLTHADYYRIITLTANDLIIKLYKRLRDGPDDA